MSSEWISPRWPAPERVRAVSTTRHGGTSRPPYDSLNLAEHVGDEAVAVAANRKQLRQAMQLPAMPAWLQQVHGVQVVNAAGVTAPVAADAAYALEPGVVCAVLTADCLPVLLCDRGGRSVAAQGAEAPLAGAQRRHPLGRAEVEAVREQLGDERVGTAHLLDVGVELAGIEDLEGLHRPIPQKSAALGARPSSRRP